MYLKEIEAHGFKSFADRVEIKLNNGITGVVGPNGSGKSNIVDAVRWVLGEQSVKSLRGDNNMTDVIFSGSKSRNPMNIATVSLLFDNSDKYLNVDYDEVSIKRKVYKDGTNEYFLNNEKVRLKDITNMLLDIGMTKESFNIISQGQIEKIINDKASERRGIFEQAAGVLKYRKRKEDALNKLDKTKDNIDRVNDIIEQLEPQIEPLKKQALLAEEYSSKKEELKKLEIGLTVKNIIDLNYEYQECKKNITLLNDEILKINTSFSKSEAKNEKIKASLLNLEEKIKECQKEVLRLTEESLKLNSQKDIITERKNYQVSDQKLHDNILRLKEDSLKLQNEIDIINADIKTNNNEISTFLSKIEKQNNELKQLKNDKNNVESKLTKELRNKNSVNLRIEFLKDSIDNSTTLPIAVKSVLNNPKLEGIVGIIGSLIETEEKYVNAINTALGFSSNYIVTENEVSAKKTINYIKNIGRATFFPLNIIKGKYVDKDTMDYVKKNPNFIALASDLVKYEHKYENIILNQLGNIIVVNNIDSAIELGKKIKNKYRIITLDGEVIHVGGSMTGGKESKKSSVVTLRYELEEKLKNSKVIDDLIAKYESKINEIDYNMKAIEDKIYLLNKDKLLLETATDDKVKQVFSLSERLNKINSDIKGTNNLVNGKLSEEEENVLKKYYEVNLKKEEQEKLLEQLNKEKKDLNETLEDYEISLKKDNSNVMQKTKELQDLEIKTNRLDVKIDNLLNNLTENYEMTYEFAKDHYHLDIEYNLAKSQSNTLKKRLNEIGIVNLAAPDEYKRVSEKYNFLIKQIEDLNGASNTLLEIIDQMDRVMIKSFKKAFDVINSNFTIIFKELFNGGSASLELTNPSNLLETGVEIKCQPPGKKLASISLLSGGEKTLTAIALLFAIIKTRPTPFCILDEVEAALDDNNVDTFGRYINTFKNTQFIIITHKKKTMEYADVLYGITMQESGVSKLVSVKLTDLVAS